MLGASSCGDKTTDSRPGAGADITLSVRSVPGLGKVIVTKGWSLYMYPPDRRKKVTCTKKGDCESAWPPLFVGAGHRVIAGPGVRQSLIGSDPGDGGQIVTYNNWPLYYYAGDPKPLELNGQGQGFNWYVMSPDGTPNKSHYTSPSG